MGDRLTPPPADPLVDVEYHLQAISAATHASKAKFADDGREPTGEGWREVWLDGGWRDVWVSEGDPDETGGRGLYWVNSKTDESDGVAGFRWRGPTEGASDAVDVEALRQIVRELQVWADGMAPRQPLVAASLRSNARRILATIGGRPPTGEASPREERMDRGGRGGRPRLRVGGGHHPQLPQGCQVPDSPGWRGRVGGTVGPKPGTDPCVVEIMTEEAGFVMITVMTPEDEGGDCDEDRVAIVSLGELRAVLGGRCTRDAPDDG